LFLSLQIKDRIVVDSCKEREKIFDSVSMLLECKKNGR